MIFELAQDFRDVLLAMPQNYAKHRMLKLLEATIRTDVNFIDRYPTTLFQEMWNTSVPNDCVAEGEDSETVPQQPLNETHRESWGRELRQFLESWRRAKTQRFPGFVWLRNLESPIGSLDGPLRVSLRVTGSSASCVALSPDGQFIAAGCQDGIARIWFVGSSRLVQKLDSSPRSSVTAISFSANGAKVATGHSDGSLCIWETRSGIKLTRFGDTDAVPVRNVRFAAGSERLTCLHGAHAVVSWDLVSGQREVLVDLEPHADACAWSCCEKVAEAAGTTVRVVDFSAGTHGTIRHALELPAITLPTHLDYENHPGAFEGCFRMDRLTLQNARRGKWSPPRPDQKVTDLAFSRCGHWLAGSLHRSWGREFDQGFAEQSILCVWQLGDRPCLHSHRDGNVTMPTTLSLGSGETIQIEGVDEAVSQDGRFHARVSHDGAVVLSDERAAVGARRLGHLASASRIRGIYMSPNDQWFMVRMGDEVCVFDATTLEQIGSVRPEREWIPRSPRFLESGNLAFFEDVIVRELSSVVTWTYHARTTNVYTGGSAMMYCDRLDEFEEQMVGHPDGAIVTNWLPLSVRENVWYYRDQPVAWFPMPIGKSVRIKRHPCNPAWIGTDGYRLYAVAVEGDEPLENDSGKTECKLNS